jgi:hypothetical protein
VGAQAAICAYGAAIFKGGAASGFRKSDGRSIGAYSGPSSHVAMQFIVDAAAVGALCAQSPAGSVRIARLHIGIKTLGFGVGAAERNGYA